MMGTRRRGFTLIEILVVVAIIALLIAILLPSLARAKAMGRMVQCQSNLRQVSVGFCTYALGDNKGRLPGTTFDKYADWLGRRNKPPFSATWGAGLEPEDGVIWKHMGKQKLAYMCPDDDLKTQDSDFVAAGKLRAFSYSSNMLVSGALVEMMRGAHYPVSDFNNPDHTGRGSGPKMRMFEGVPMLVEEDYDRTLIYNAEGGWGNTDGVTGRHLKIGVTGYGNIGFTDSHVGRVRLPPGVPGVLDWFSMNNHCIRKLGTTWVSGEAVNAPGLYDNGVYGLMDRVWPANMPPAGSGLPAILH